MCIKKSIDTLTVDKVIVIFCLLPAITFGLAITQSDSTLSNDSLRSFLRVFNYICMGTLLTFSIVKRKVMKNSILLATVPIIYWLFYYLHVYIRPSVNFLSIIMLILFSLTDKENKRRIFRMYYKAIVIMSFVGIIIYLLYYFKLPFPYSRVKYYVLNDDALYFNYKISYLYVSNATGVARLCGLFNEPGYFGTIIGFCLCIEQLNFKKLSNIILLVAGCFTLSLAFFLILILYFSICSTKKPIRMLCFAIMCCVFFLLLENVEIKNDTINAVLSRFRINANGKLAGDNRATPFLDKEINRIFSAWNYQLFFGYGTGYSSTLPSVGLSFKTYLLHYGIVGLITIYGVPFVMSYHLSFKNFKSYAFIVCFFISLYQRPDLYMLNYFVLLFGGIEYLKFQDEMKTIKIQKACSK